MSRILVADVDTNSLVNVVDELTKYGHAKVQMVHGSTRGLCVAGHTTDGDPDPRAAFSWPEVQNDLRDAATQIVAASLDTPWHFSLSAIKQQDQGWALTVLAEDMLGFHATKFSSMRTRVTEITGRPWSPTLSFINARVRDTGSLTPVFEVLDRTPGTENADVDALVLFYGLESVDSIKLPTAIVELHHTGPLHGSLFGTTSQRPSTQPDDSPFIGLFNVIEEFDIVCADRGERGVGFSGFTSGTYIDALENTFATSIRQPSQRICHANRGRAMVMTIRPQFLCAVKEISADTDKLNRFKDMLIQNLVQELLAEAQVIFDHNAHLWCPEAMAAHKQKIDAFMQEFRAKGNNIQPDDIKAFNQRREEIISELDKITSSSPSQHLGPSAYSKDDAMRTVKFFPSREGGGSRPEDTSQESDTTDYASGWVLCEHP